MVIYCRTSLSSLCEMAISSSLGLPPGARNAAACFIISARAASTSAAISEREQFAIIDSIQELRRVALSFSSSDCTSC